MEQLSSLMKSRLAVEPLVDIGVTNTFTYPSRPISSHSVRKCSLEDITVCLNSGKVHIVKSFTLLGNQMFNYAVIIFQAPAGIQDFQYMDG